MFKIRSEPNERILFMFGAIISGFLTVISYLFGISPIYVVFFFCISCISIFFFYQTKRKLIPLHHPDSLDSRGFKSLTIISFLLLSITIILFYSRPEVYVRPMSFFILISFTVVAVIFQSFAAPSFKTGRSLFFNHTSRSVYSTEHNSLISRDLG